jgi:hypothetical protein
MAGGKLNPDMETAKDAEWLRASERATLQNIPKVL